MQAKHVCTLQGTTIVVKPSEKGGPWQPPWSILLHLCYPSVCSGRPTPWALCSTLYTGWPAVLTGTAANPKSTGLDARGWHPW